MLDFTKYENGGSLNHYNVEDAMKGHDTQAELQIYVPFILVLN